MDYQFLAQNIFKYEWNFAETNQITLVNAQNIELDATPIIFSKTDYSSTLSIHFPDGNELDAFGPANMGGDTVTWQEPIISSNCPDSNFTVTILNKPENDFYQFGNHSINYQVSNSCGQTALANVLVKVANSGGLGDNCHPNHYNVGFIGGFQGHLYLVTKEKMTISEGIEFAQNHGGRLASIETLEEHAFIKRQLNEVAVVGLSDAETEGTLKWENGTELTYSKIDTCS